MSRKRLPGGYEESRLLATLGEEGCPICHDTAGSDDHYFFWFFNENATEAFTLDALTRSLGFCPAHGARLARNTGGFYQLAGVHAVLARRTRAILSSHVAGQAKSGKRGSALATYDLCPTCRDREQSAERTAFWLARLLEDPSLADRYARPGILCSPHLKTVSRRLGAITLERLLAIHDAGLKSVIDSVGELRAELRRIPSEGRQDLLKGLLPSLLLAVGHDTGHSAFPLLSDELKASQRVKDPIGDFLEAIRRDDACPICIEVHRAWIEWIRWLDEAANRGVAIDDLLPTCPEHVWPTVHGGGAFLAAATAQQALSAALWEVHTASLILRPPPSPDRKRRLVRLRSIVRLRPTLWELRARLRSAREALTRGLQCPVCERLAVARDRALSLLFALIEDRHHRTAVEGGYGLCLKHFSRALALDPAPAARAVLVEVAAARLARLQWELEEATRKIAWTVRAETAGTEQTAWRRAVLRFSGSLARELG